MKAVRDWGSITVGTTSARQSVEEIAPLGDVISWAIRGTITSVAGTATWLANGGTPAGAHRGSSWHDFFQTVVIKDKGSVPIFNAAREDIGLMSYLLSVIDIDDWLFRHGFDSRAVVDTGALTASVRYINMPQRIKLSDLPAKIEITIGVLDDYFDAVGTGTASLPIVSFEVRYMPPDGKNFTERINASNVASFSANRDISREIPDAIHIQLLAFTLGDYSAVAAPAEQNEDRFDNLSFRRGSAEEIEEVDERSMHFYTEQKYVSARPLGMYIVPTDDFIKTEGTVFFFRINAAIAPRLYYIYTT